MERIAVYGKGGIGKSTFATSASLVLSRMGNRVLHVGCDPKHDSSVVLVEDPTHFRTVMNKVFAGEDVFDPEDIVMKGIEGIDCVESGGPDAGRGCGGRAVSRSFEVFEDVELVDAETYDAVVYDVLGDVVCGGFAAPMRKSARSKVVIVLSEELMAAYAANRIAAAVREFHSNDVRLAGFVINLKSNQADIRPIQRFAEAIGTRVLGVLPRDPLVCEAEMYRQCIVQYAPDSPVAVGIQAVVEAVVALDRDALDAPKPLLEHDLRRIMRGGSTDEPLPSPPPIELRKSKITEWSQVG
ncbi:MAG: ArsA-related P-loop ATPase [Myxococcota bacterium]|nr:ArsA-related P-loop ATPase [Myxococcota bacterium]MEC9389004.1 ArsA-related P-loop ATPase [Myxococcota bacterium]